MASRVFNEFKRRVVIAGISLTAGTFKAALLNTSTTVHTDAQSGITNVDDFGTLSEIAGTGYTRATLGTLAVTRDDANSRVLWTCANIAYGALASNNGTVKGMLIIFNVDGTAANDVPVAWSEFSSNLVTDGSNVTIQINAAGLLNFT